MIVAENEIAIKKFKMFAEKADSEKDLVNLCRKYLKHKGIDIDTPLLNHFEPKEPQRIYVGMKDIMQVRGQFIVDGFDNSTRQISDELIYAKRYVIDNITHDLVKNDMIEIETFRKMDTYQTIVRGTLNVWKNPNVK